MSKLLIEGGYKLKGELTVPGAKNAVLPILAATVLNKGVSIIEKTPNLIDLHTMTDILESIGCKITRKDNKVYVDSSVINSNVIPEALAGKMRSSIILMGALLGRLGEIKIAMPGGCEIGPRPIDLHLKTLKRMGAEIDDLDRGILCCRASRLKGADVLLDFPSVGATENIMLAACFAEGETIIRNAAKEPEIQNLQSYLNSLGVAVVGAGTGVISVKGVKKIQREVKHCVIPDRIAAGTYMISAAATGGTLILKEIVYEHISSIVNILRETGSKIKWYGDDTIKIISESKPKNIDIIRTLPYPGFPTDMQPQLTTLLSVADGTSIVVETVFENRYKYVEQLMRMGADINVQGRTAVIKGVDRLLGADIVAKDLRGGAALVIAGLMAEGTTSVSGLEHIDRGYENIENILSALGAKIQRIRC